MCYMFLDVCEYTENIDNKIYLRVLEGGWLSQSVRKLYILIRLPATANESDHFPIS